MLCAADGLYERRISEAMHRGEYPPYKASGMEYIRFAAAERFHLEMWIFVHGIAVMVATGYLEWDMDFVSDALTHMYGAMLADKRGVKNGSDKN